MCVEAHIGFAEVWHPVRGSARLLLADRRGIGDNGGMMTPWQRTLFDSKLEDAIDRLPSGVRGLLEEVPVIVEDEPAPALLIDLGMDPHDEDLCGLHSGVALTERSVEQAPAVPDQIMLFRGPIYRLAQSAVPGTGRDAVAELDRQVRVTLLHEIGHHFGLDEDDLNRLGYA